MAQELGRGQVIKGFPMLLHMAFQGKLARALTRAYLGECQLEDGALFCNSETLGRCNTRRAPRIGPGKQ